MTRFLFATSMLLGSLLFAVSSASTGEKVVPINIEYHGQSFFIITTSKGTRVALDPHTIPAYHPTGVVKQHAADIVCISHNHPDHTRLEAIKPKKDLKVLRGLKTMSLKSDWAVINETINDVKIRTVNVYHDTTMGLERGKNAIFIIEADGWRIAHLGDLGHLLEAYHLKQINRNGPIDVLMIPVGGIYTLNGAEAKKVVDQIKPKEYIFPMHFGTKVFEDILPPDEFYDGIEKRRIAVSDENELKLNKDEQRPRPLIVQLHYWSKEAQKEEKKKK